MVLGLKKKNIPFIKGFCFGFGSVRSTCCHSESLEPGVDPRFSMFLSSKWILEKTRISFSWQPPKKFEIGGQCLMNRNSKKKNPSEWWCYYFCVYTLGSAPGHYLDPRPLDVIASKSKDRLPASACHLTSTGCQTDVSFHLSPDGPHILSIKVSFSFSCDYRCLGKFAEKYWSSP